MSDTQRKGGLAIAYAGMLLAIASVDASGQFSNRIFAAMAASLGMLVGYSWAKLKSLSSVNNYDTHKGEKP